MVSNVFVYGEHVCTVYNTMLALGIKIWPEKEEKKEMLRVGFEPATFRFRVAGCVTVVIVITYTKLHSAISFG